MFKNPQFDSLKVTLLLVAFIGAGYFAATYYQKNSLSNKGQVIDTKGEMISSADHGFAKEFVFDVTTLGESCSVSVCSASDIRNCVVLSGVSGEENACVIDETQSNERSQRLADILTQ